MPTELITSKSIIPPLRHSLVPRLRLVNLLNAGLNTGHRLTLVSAPAGFGKTTLVVAWLKQITLPTAWLSLDESDNDLPRFLAYLAEAFQRIDEEIAVPLLNALQSPQLPAIEKALTALLNEIALQKDPLILALDDYHLLSEGTILEAMKFLLQNLPPQLHLVLITREDPDLPLARLRVRDQLTEIRARDLRFTPEETDEFLRDVMGLELSTQDVVVLEGRTEGWVAGLQLAGLSMQKQVDKKSFIKEFSGSHRHILDYLTDEVIRQQPESIRTFLLHTAILDQLNGSLCDALTEARDSNRILAQLEASNLFVIPLDEERRWYRYHHLFCDLLRNQLARSEPELIPELHRRASCWYEEHGFIQAAIDHALQDVNLAHAAQLIETYAFPMLYQGEVSTVLGWFERLPEPYLQFSSMMCIARAWSLVLMQRQATRTEEVQQALQASEKALDWTNADEGFRNLIAGHAASIQVFILESPASPEQEPKKLIETAQKALRLLPEEEKAIRSVNFMNLGNSYTTLMDLPAAEKAYQQALDDGVAGGNYYAAVYGPINLILIAMVKGQLKFAFELCETNIERFNRILAGQRFPPIGGLYILRGCILLEENRLAEAEQELILGLSLVRWTGEFRTHMKGYSAMARLRSAQGERMGMAESLKLLEGTRPESAPYAQALRHRFSADDPDENKINSMEAYPGLTQAAARFSTLPDITGIDFMSRIRFQTFLSDAYILTRLAARNPKAYSFPEVHKYFSRQEEFANTHELYDWLIEIWIARALLYHVEGKAEEAQQMIRMALSACEPRGYFRIFLDEGDLLRPLLESVVQRLNENDLSTYVKRLLEAMPGEPIKGKMDLDREEALSDRELQVLSLLAAGQSYKEIGQKLFLSLNTIQFHVKNIYSKLLVNKRVQAIEKAREMNLI